VSAVESLGGRIAQSRLNAGARRGKAYTQTELGKAVGVTPATVSQWEAGASEPGLATIARIASALGVDAGYLAFGQTRVEPGVLNPAHDFKLVPPEAVARAMKIAERGKKSPPAKKAPKKRVVGRRGRAPEVDE
jgi:transcriptional regulator with XRE-family HTH domain